MFNQKFLIFLMLGLGICQLLFSFGEGALYAGYSEEDIESIYKSHIVTSTVEGQKVPTVDIAPKATEDSPAKINWLNTIIRAATWNYGILNTGLGVYVKQFLLLPLSFCLLAGFFLVLIQSIPIFGRGG